MLSLPDATGRIVPVLPARPGLLTLGVDGDLRAAVAADTLRRTAELMGLRVRVTSVPLDAGALDAFNVRPAEPLDGPVDLLVTSTAVAARCLVVPRLDVEPGLTGRLGLLGTAWGAAEEPDLDGAAAELRRWRGAVAAWAEQPSGPIVASARASLVDAFGEGLDTARGLVVLRAVETLPDISDGSRFETFAWADRLLGLDLARDVGR